MSPSNFCNFSNFRQAPYQATDYGRKASACRCATLSVVPGEQCLRRTLRHSDGGVILGR